jgi:hypothetical protein
MPNDLTLPWVIWSILIIYFDDFRVAGFFLRLRTDWNDLVENFLFGVCFYISCSNFCWFSGVRPSFFYFSNSAYPSVIHPHGLCVFLLLLNVCHGRPPDEYAAWKDPTKLVANVWPRLRLRIISKRNAFLAQDGSIGSFSFVPPWNFIIASDRSSTSFWKASVTLGSEFWNFCSSYPIIWEFNCLKYLFGQG